MRPHERIARVARGDAPADVEYRTLADLTADLRALWVDYAGQVGKREDAERENTRLRNVTRQAMDEITLAVAAAEKRYHIARDAK